MKKVWNKLVRDAIPDLIRKNGEKVKVHTLQVSEYRAALKDKLLEEVTEVVAAKNKKELVEELADVQEVLQALREAYKIDKKDVTAAATKKRQRKGGFSKRIFLEYTG